MGVKEKINFLAKQSHLFSKKEKIEFIWIVLAVIVMALFQALGLASVVPFVSLVMEPELISTNVHLSGLYDFFGFTNERSFIIASGVLMLLLIVVGNLFSAFAIWLKTRFVWRKNHRLSTALLHKYLSLSYSYFLNQNTADLSKNILAEVQNLTSNFMIPLLEVFSDLVILSLIFLTLIIVSPMATITILFIFSFFYAFIYKSGFRGRLKAYGRERLRENKGRYKAASEALGGIKDLKVLGREKFFLNKFVRHSIKFSDLQAWNAVVGKVPRYFIEIIAFGGVIVFILIFMITDTKIQQTIPLVSFFAFAGYRVMPIMNRMFQAFTRLQFNRAVLDKIHKDLGGHSFDALEFDRKKDSVEPLDFKKNIVLKDISFVYPRSAGYVFKGIDMTIDKNSSVAIVGPTGTGKTTLVDIILGLLDPTSGYIEVDGVRIDERNKQNWQRDLGYVPQQIFLSDDKVMRNIAFGVSDEEIDRKRLEEAAQISNIHDFIINEMPKGYDTLVGERGIRLSGGQRQRLGIARALYDDPEVLVLDEATSSLDGITEQAVLKAMENISKIKTLIIIAHRLTTVKQCDMVYLMDKGRIAARGVYEELMRTNAQFRAMAREL